MPDAVAELNRVEVSFRGRRVLGPLSLTINRGDCVGVAGPNGAGKSTLLRVLAGLERPSRGTLRVLGEDPARCTGLWGLPAWRRRVGVLFQHHEFCGDVPITAAEVVGFGLLARPGGGWVSRCPGETPDARVRNAMQHLGIQHLASCLYRELSGGERQRVQMARLLAQNAELMLLDEPAAGLDLDARERVTRLASSLRRDHGATVVMVTHEIDRLPADCTAVVLLPLGGEPLVGPPEELLAGGPLSRAYGTQVEVIRQGGRVLARASLGEGPP